MGHCEVQLRNANKTHSAVLVCDKHSLIGSSTVADVVVVLSPTQ